MNDKNKFSGKPLLGPKPGSVIVVKALHNYTAKQANELSFCEGDILYVYDRSNSDWWQARNGSKCGLIPSQYVKGELEEIVNPLHEAARRGNILFLKECLRQKVSSTGLDSMGNTPLHWASHSGHIDCLKHLLAQPNPPVNAQNHFGDTPLHEAAAKNQLEVAHILLEAGCNPKISNNNNETPDKLALSQKMKSLLQNYISCSQSKNFTLSNPEDYEDDSE